MSLEVVIRHTRRERDLCAQELAELQQCQAIAQQAVQSADQNVAQAAVDFQIQGTQIASVGALRQRYASLHHWRQQATAAREHLQDIESEVAQALQALVAVRQQLKIYERLQQRRSRR